MNIFLYFIPLSFVLYRVIIIDFGFKYCSLHIIKSQKGLLNTIEEYGANIGGVNFDNVIMKHLAEEFKNQVCINKFSVFTVISLLQQYWYTCFQIVILEVIC